eukprot:m.103001 g.103001  ORF g.103001 m.103001 type:complete len:103 (+) comp9088_c6_seq1:497-805(+)
MNSLHHGEDEVQRFSQQMKHLQFDLVKPSSDDGLQHPTTMPSIVNLQQQQPKVTFQPRSQNTLSEIAREKWTAHKEVDEVGEVEEEVEVVEEEDGNENWAFI